MILVPVKLSCQDPEEMVVFSGAQFQNPRADVNVVDQNTGTDVNVVECKFSKGIWGHKGLLVQDTFESE